MSKDGRDSATLILIKNSHFNRTALYALSITPLSALFPSRWHWARGLGPVFAHVLGKVDLVVKYLLEFFTFLNLKKFNFFHHSN